MPAPTNTARIDELTKVTSSLDERIGATRGELADLKKRGDDISSQFHQLETQAARIDETVRQLRDRLDRSDANDRLARIEEKLNNATKELDKLRSNRFEIGKLIVAAILGGAVAFGFNLLTEVIKSARGAQPIQRVNP